jgi:hypothetical protein
MPTTVSPFYCREGIINLACPACPASLPLQYEEFLQALHNELPVLGNPPHKAAVLHSAAGS